MKVYMVKFDWRFSDDEDVDIQLFDTYKKAYDHFLQIIKEEKNPDNSWVGSDVFDKDGNIYEGYEVDEHIESDGTQEYVCWWEVTDKYDWDKREYLTLQIMEVK